jgi:predicted DNA-binding protein with PD1-like motif
MRIEADYGQQHARAYLWVTLAEAAELRDALQDLLREPRSECHAHVSAADFQKEVTLAWDEG